MVGLAWKTDPIHSFVKMKAGIEMHRGVFTVTIVGSDLDPAILIAKRIEHIATEKSHMLDISRLTANIVRCEAVASGEQNFFENWEHYWAHIISPVFFGYSTERIISRRKRRIIGPKEVRAPMKVSKRSERAFWKTSMYASQRASEANQQSKPAKRSELVATNCRCCWLASLTARFACKPFGRRAYSPMYEVPEMATEGYKANPPKSRRSFAIWKRSTTGRASCTRGSLPRGWLGASTGRRTSTR